MTSPQDPAADDAAAQDAAPKDAAAQDAAAGAAPSAAAGTPPERSSTDPTDRPAGEPTAYDGAVTAELGTGVPTAGEQLEDSTPEPAQPAAAPADATSAEPAPVEPASAEPAPVEPVPAEPVPAEPVPAGSAAATDGERRPVDLVKPAPAAPAADRPAADPLAADPPAGDYDDHASPADPARPGLLPVLLLGLLALALLAGTVFLGLRLRAEQQTERARDQAVAASRDAARVLFSYDHARLEEDFAKGLAVTTGRFRDEYSRTTKEVVAPVATQYKAVVVADVVESAVVEAGPDEVTTLVFLNQATTSTRTTGQQVDLSRVRMRLVERGGRWLVSEVKAL